MRISQADVSRLPGSEDELQVGEQVFETYLREADERTYLVSLHTLLLTPSRRLNGFTLNFALYLCHGSRERLVTERVPLACPLAYKSLHGSPISHFVLGG